MNYEAFKNLVLVLIFFVILFVLMVRGVKGTPYIIGNSFYPIQTYLKKKKLKI